MATTVQVEFDGELLSRLRARHPGKTDRELLERLAVIELGMAALRASQARNSDPEEVVLEEGPGRTWVKRFVEGPNAGTRFVARFELLGDEWANKRWNNWVNWTIVAVLFLLSMVLATHFPTP